MDRQLSRRTFLKFSAATTGTILLAACAPVPAAQPAATGGAASDVLTLQLANWEGGLALEAIKASAEEFHLQNPNIQIDVFSPPGNYFEKIPAMIAAGEPPDIIEITETQTPQFAAQNVLISLDDFIASSPEIDMEDFFALQQEWQWDGKNYGLFYGFNNWALYYNKNHFDEAGLSYPDETWTYAELAEAAATLTKSEGGRTSQWGINWPRFYGAYFFQMWANGGSYLNPERTQTLIAEPQSYEGLQWWSDLTNVHQAAPAVGAVQGNPFLGGLAALDVSTSWSAPDLVSKAPEFEWGVTLLPAPTADLPRAITGLAAAWGIPTQNQHPAESWEVLKWTVGDMTLALAQIGASIPSRKSLADQYWPDGGDLRDPFLAMSEFVRAMETTPTTADQLKVLDDGIAQLWIGQKTAQEVAEEIAPQLNSLLEG